MLRFVLVGFLVMRDEECVTTRAHLLTLCVFGVYFTLFVLFVGCRPSKICLVDIDGSALKEARRRWDESANKKWRDMTGGDSNQVPRLYTLQADLRKGLDLGKMSRVSN
jgi:hypothetical protein